MISNGACPARTWLIGDRCSAPRSPDRRARRAVARRCRVRCPDRTCGHEPPRQHRRGDRQRLGGRPIDPLAGFDLVARLASSWRAILGLRPETPRGRSHQSPSQFAQHVGGTPVSQRDHRRAAPVRAPPRRHIEPNPPCSGDSSWPSRTRLRGRATKRGPPSPPAHLRRRHPSPRPGVRHIRCRVVGWAAIVRYIKRLGESRLVALVVPVPAIAEQIDDDVLLEMLTVFRGDSGDLDHGFGIIAVDVEDRRLDALCRIRRVRARSPGRRARREADLVVDDDMDRAAGGKPGQFGQFERFSDEPLAGEGGIAVHQDAGVPALRPLSPR